MKKQKGIVFPTMKEESSDIVMATKPEPERETEDETENIDTKAKANIDLDVSVMHDVNLDLTDIDPDQMLFGEIDCAQITLADESFDPNATNMDDTPAEEHLDDTTMVDTLYEENLDPNAASALVDAEEYTVSDNMELSGENIVGTMEKEDVLVFEVKKVAADKSIKEFNELMEIKETEMKCKMCPDEVFEKKYKLINHVMIKHGSRHLIATEICQFCVEVFSTSKAFDNHMAEKHRNQNVPRPKYVCRLCDKDDARFFLNLQNMARHAATNHQAYNYQPYKCEHCPMQFLIEEEYLDHLAAGHDHKSIEFTCKKCPVVNRSRKNYLVHQSLHEDLPNLAFCQYCDFASETGELDLIEHHHNNHPMEMPPLFMCDKCDLIEKHLDAMKKHCVSEHNHTDYKPFLCTKCHMSFKNFHGMMKHHQAAHSPKSSVCETCKSSFETPEELNEHIAENHSDTSEKFMCDVCGFDTFVEVLLKKHCRSRHKNKARVKCPHCPKHLPGKDKVEIHIDRVHPETAEKKFGPCEFCGKTFIYEKTFKHHKFECTKQGYRKKYMDNLRAKGYFQGAYGFYARKRKEEKARSNVPGPYSGGKKYNVKCDYCPEIFNNSFFLKAHYSSIHPGMPIILPTLEKFMCEETECLQKDITQKLFFDKKDFERHQMRNHGKRFDLTKNQCPDCKMEYSGTHKCPKASNRKDSDKKRNCKHCKKILFGTVNLRNHIKKMHKEVCLRCPEGCTKIFATILEQRNHMRNCHQHVSCDLCGKKIVNAYELKRHKVLAHNITVGAFTCRLCPKSVLFSKRQYEIHMDTYHTGYKQVRKRLRLNVLDE